MRGRRGRVVVGFTITIDGWFSPGTPVSSTNKTERLYITKILLNVALNTINQTYSMKYFDWLNMVHECVNWYRRYNKVFVSIFSAYMYFI